MINPVAFFLVIIGIILLVFGVIWLVRRSKTVGIAISLIGIGVAAIPCLVSLFLAH